MVYGVAAGTVPHDFAQTFQIEGLDVRGRLVRLGPELALVLDAHAYPVPVARMLAETLTLAVVLASALKYEGLFTLQVQSDGPISLLLADVGSDGAMRAYARFDAERLRAVDAGAGASVPRLLGSGHMAFSVDQGADMDRYQGIVALESGTLAECAQVYFRVSEQLETAIFLAVRGLGEEDDGAPRTGALMVQRMPGQDTRDAPDGWRRAVALMASVGADELLDPDLEKEQLLYRLYHEDAVRVYEPHALFQRCRCSRARVAGTLKSFPRGEITGDDGHALVVCEFCKADYDFTPADLDQLYGATQG